MSDTPQTDAQPIQFVRVADVNGTERMEPYVPAEAMRRIERAYFQICCGWADMEVALHEAKRERDEARKALQSRPQTVARFEAELRELINKNSIENSADMPDFLLAKMICRFIEAVGPSIKDTLDWHGCNSVCHPASALNKKATK